MEEIQLYPQRFDIAQLRGAFVDAFANWDRAVSDCDTAAAKRARRSIRLTAFQGLDAEAAKMGGFYLFLDSSMQNGLSGLHYIGIADTPSRPIGRRIIDRLRDDSALDTGLDTVSPEEAQSIVHERLICALPQSGHNYVVKHLTAADLFRRSPEVLLIGCAESMAIIREAEKVLIGSAHRAGAPLINRQHIRFKGPASRDAVRIACAVVDLAGVHGLGKEGASQWTANIQSDFSA